MKVYVYYNLHKHLFSVRAEEGPNKGRVIAHMNELMLQDATFHVGEKARQRVIQTRCKSVHAGVRGRLLPQEHPLDLGAQDWTPVGYNPYQAGHFMDRRIQRPVAAAETAYLAARAVMVRQPKYKELA